MENILLATDVNESFLVPEFGCWLADITKSRLTAVFLENIKTPSFPDLKTIHGKPYIETIVSGDLPESQVRLKKCAEYSKFFEEACDRRGVRSAIHLDGGLPLEELIHESRFADLLIVDSELKIESSDSAVPSHFVESLLEKSECPVILSPAAFDGIEEIIFAYDGTSSAVFAIKQFTYLLPELSDKRLIVLQAATNSFAITERNKLAALLQPRYSSIAFNPIPGKADDALLDYLLGKKNVLLVMGSYGRTMISRFFHKSTASRLVRTFNIPVFIAHR